MRNWKVLFYAAALSVLVLIGATVAPVFSQKAQDRIRGTVSSPDGKPMEGATITIRGTNDPYDTTVFTNAKGVFVFPPMSGSPSYHLLAQAVGFEPVKEDVSAGSKVAPIQLKTLANFEKQLTGVEWMNSFPETTPQERREKLIFANNCSGCHDEHFALQNRFDSDGWNKIVTVMSKSSEGTVPRPNYAGMASLNEYKDEIVAFLTKVRGPNPRNYDLKPLPRPTGEATQVVVTEFDTPRPEAPPEYLVHDGLDWTEGVPSRWQGRSTHSATVGGDGHVYFSDDRTLYATLHELDPKTGVVTDLAFRSPDGVASTHGITTDADGNVWANNGATGDFLEFNVKTQKFTDYPRPAGMKATVGGTLDADAHAFKGMVWATSGTGAIKIDGKTGEYTFFPNPTSKGTYGFAVDRHGNGWYTSPQGDKVYEVDAETGKTSEVSFDPMGPADGTVVTDKDRNAYATVKSGPDDTNAIQVCPRRMGADPNADVVWVAMFCSDKIAKIDTLSHQVTQYLMPHKYSRPYGMQVDNNHMVWINETNTDMIAKFDPSTQKFIEYQLPTRGTDVRQVAFDYSTNPLSVYIEYSRENKVARLTFRKASDMQ